MNTETKNTQRKFIKNKKEYIPFEISSRYVKPLHTYSGFFIKQTPKIVKRKEIIEEKIIQYSVNIGLKEKEQEYVVTIFENNMLIEKTVYNTRERAEEYAKLALKGLPTLGFTLIPKIFKSQEELIKWQLESNNSNYIPKED